MKKTAALLLGLAFVFALAGCGTKTASDTDSGKSATVISEKECVTVCQNYLSENNSEAVKTITDWDNPAVETIKELPNDYHKTADVTNSDNYYEVTFTTTEDGVLGPIILFLDEEGNIIGQGIRE